MPGQPTPTLLPAVARAAAPALAWRGLAELHDRAVAEPGDEDAFHRFSTATAAVVGQIATCDLGARLRMLGSLCDFVESRRSVDGVETVLLAAVRGTQIPPGFGAVIGTGWGSGQRAEVVRAQTLWRQHPPQRLDGGATHLALLVSWLSVLTVASALDLSDPVAPTETPLLAFPFPAADTAPEKVDGMPEVARAVLASACAVAGTSVLARRLPPVRSPRLAPFDVAEVLTRSPVDGAPGPASAIAQGHSIMVDVVVLAPGAAEAEPPPADADQPPAILRPRLATLSPGADGAYDLAAGQHGWRGPSAIVPTFVLADLDVDRFLVPVDGTTVALQSLPHIGADGTISVRGFLDPVLPAPSTPSAGRPKGAATTEEPGLIDGSMVVVDDTGSPPETVTGIPLTVLNPLTGEPEYTLVIGESGIVLGMVPIPSQPSQLTREAVLSTLRELGEKLQAHKVAVDTLTVDDTLQIVTRLEQASYKRIIG